MVKEKRIQKKPPVTFLLLSEQKQLVNVDEKVKNTPEVLLDFLL